MYTWLAAQPYKLLGAMNITTNFEDEKNVPVVRSLAELIAELHKVFAHDKVNVEYVKALLNAYKSEPNDWKEYAKFDDFRFDICNSACSSLCRLHVSRAYCLDYT